MTYEKGTDKCDFMIHEDEDVDIRITVDDPNGEIITLVGAVIQWKAKVEKTGTMLIQKTTADGGIEISDTLVFVVHIQQADTLELVPFRRTKMSRETIITKGGKTLVGRFMNNNTGFFELRQAI